MQAERRQTVEFIWDWGFAREVQQRERRLRECLQENVYDDVCRIKIIQKSKWWHVRANSGDVEGSQERGQGIRSIDVKEWLQWST